ncbi:MAG: endonuclease/exonuclease/phosphatase family protein [Planctomycetes bacterium]|nr:endonuclease/exonuclease/phosphatase family protein [Planctomycetota bacterium]
MLRVLTYNVLEGGADRAMGERTEPILDVLRETAPDVAVLVEANGFDQEARRRVFEEATNMRAFVTTAPTGYHVAILVGRGHQVAWHAPEPGRFFHAAAALAIDLPTKVVKGATNLPRRLTVVAAHLDPFSPEARLAEARVLARHANPLDRVVLMGDFNALPPDDPIDPSVLQLPRRILARHVGVPVREGVFDTRAHDVLRWAGFQDVYRKLNAKKPGWTLLTTRFAAELRSRMRVDFVYATEKLAAKAIRAEVLETDATRRASDHYPIVVEFEV